MKFLTLAVSVNRQPAARQSEFESIKTQNAVDPLHRCVMTKSNRNDINKIIIFLNSLENFGVPLITIHHQLSFQVCQNHLAIHYLLHAHIPAVALMVDSSALAEWVVVQHSSLVAVVDSTAVASSLDSALVRQLRATLQWDRTLAAFAATKVPWQDKQRCN